MLGELARSGTNPAPIIFSYPASSCKKISSKSHPQERKSVSFLEESTETEVPGRIVILCTQIHTVDEVQVSVLSPELHTVTLLRKRNAVPFVDQLETNFKFVGSDDLLPPPSEILFICIAPIPFPSYQQPSNTIDFISRG